MKVRILVLTILISLFFFCPSLEAGIGVTPTVTEISINAGASEEGIFTVFNNGEKAVSINVEPEDWFKRRFGNEDLSVSSWLKIDPMEFNLDAGEQKRIKYRITLPEDLKGELMAMVFFASTGPKGGVAIKSRFGVALYVAAEGTQILEAEISKVDVSKYEIESEKKGLQKGIKFAVAVKNKGNVHIRPHGEVIIKDRQGNEIEKINILQGFPVFAGETNTYYALWEDATPKRGEYKAFATFHYGVIYNTEAKTCSKQTTFFINENGEIE